MSDKKLYLSELLSQCKPCSVLVERLEEDVIYRWTSQSKVSSPSLNLTSTVSTQTIPFSELDDNQNKIIKKEEEFKSQPIKFIGDESGDRLCKLIDNNSTKKEDDTTIIDVKPKIEPITEQVTIRSPKNVLISSNTSSCKSTQSSPATLLYSIPNPYYKALHKIESNLQEAVSIEENNKANKRRRIRATSTSSTLNGQSSTRCISPFDRSSFRQIKSSKKTRHCSMKNPFACERVDLSADELTVMFYRAMNGLPVIGEHDLLPKEEINVVTNSVSETVDNFSDDDYMAIDFNENEFNQMLFKLSDNDELDLMSSEKTNYIIT